MLFQQLILPNDAIIGIWKIEETIDNLLSKLSAETIEDKRFQSITNEKRKRESLCVRMLLKVLCGEEKLIVYSESGKPSLADDSLQISISHTNNYVAVILHPTSAVGIDIEKLSERILKLKEKFMHPSEIGTIDKNFESLHTLLYWSAKETLFKILPESEIDFIEHLHIKPFAIKEKGNFKANETRTKSQQEFNIQYQVFSDFVLTWCTK